MLRNPPENRELSDAVLGVQVLMIQHAVCPSGLFSFVHVPLLKFPLTNFFTYRELRLLNVSFVAEVQKTLWLSRKIWRGLK